MVNRSMTDVAFEALNKKKKPVLFNKLWEEVVETLGYNAEVADRKLATFYQNLSLDARFVVVENNKWDLKSRHTFNEIHRDLSDMLDEDDDSEYNYDDDEDENEDKDVKSSEEDY